MEPLPYLIPPELEHSEPVSREPLQDMLLPHLAALESAYTVLWVSILVFVVVTYIIKPLRKLSAPSYEHQSNP